MSLIFEPVGQRIMVKLICEKEVRGILVPKDAQKRSLLGRIVHKGPDAEWVKKDDIVLFAQYSGTKPYIEYENLRDKYEDCLIMNCEDILCVVRENGKAPS